MNRDVPWPGARRSLAWLVPGLLSAAVLVAVAGTSMMATWSALNPGTAALAVAMVTAALLVLGGPDAVRPRLLGVALVFVAGVLCVILAGVAFGPRIDLPGEVVLDLSGGGSGTVGDAVVLPAVVAGVVISVVDAAVTRSEGTLGGRRGPGTRLPPESHVAFLLAILGIASLGGWFLSGAATTGPLLYFGGIGLFGAVLVSLLLPERSLPPVVAEGLHRALVSAVERGGNAGATRAVTVYRPGPDGEGDTGTAEPGDVRVHTVDGEFRNRDSIESEPSTAATGARSAAAGAVLYRAFRAEAIPEIGATPETFAWQLCRGLTDWFDLATDATPEVESTGGMTIHVEGSTLPGVDRFDHPIVSFLGVALACYRDRPIAVDVQPGEGELESYRIDLHPFAIHSRDAHQLSDIQP